ncbi:hypothetical protein E2C01_062264 [Portunus trituberculatus]|uniref:Uncharacterized protein n=1 Tax=Portunus trituberculatus TaxID=210409 RepID=A0A5B7HD58_PORTR|nr:hypothetical protein [Portunus trituberculatus]
MRRPKYSEWVTLAAGGCHGLKARSHERFFPQLYASNYRMWPHVNWDISQPWRKDRDRERGADCRGREDKSDKMARRHAEVNKISIFLLYFQFYM